MVFGRRYKQKQVLFVKQKTTNMRSFLFIIALVLIIGWGIGIFFYALKGLFNIVLILAAIAFILGIFNRRSTT